ncbi:unnamed protein product, partial [Symbiodinium necroappetens]
AMSNKKGAVQTYLWHPKTQSEFLEKALWSTEPEELTLIPRLEFADGVSKVSQLLSIYPKDQTTKDTGSDAWGWEVIQAAGAYSDLQKEVERRFAELPDPSFCDKVDDPEVETLLTALGRSDNAAAAMKVLGPHAGKVKQAKEAVTKMIAQLSPPQARVLIRQVMLPKKAGVGLQVAGLKKIVDLRIPDPLELYTFVWRKGECQRDVAGNILSKVATSGEFRPDDVRFYFDYFDRTDNQDDQAYVAQIMLDQLIEQPEWVLPYLPKVVSKLAMVPGATNKSVQALKSCTSNVSDVVEALTHVVQASRLAARTDPKVNREGTDGRVLADLINLISFGQFTETVNSVARMSLEDCDPATLKTFLREAFQRWEDAVAGNDSNAKGYFSCALTAWVKLLRPGQYNTWVTELAELEKRTHAKGNVESWGQMAQALAGHAPDLGLSPDEWDQMLQVLRAFFVRLLEGPLSVNDEVQNAVTPADDTFKKENASRAKIRNELLETHWMKLLSHGCTEDESNELFKRCPESEKVKLASNLVQEWHKRNSEETTRETKAAAFQQERPDGGWKHTGGKPVSQITVGSIVSGHITNSSKEFGVYVNFGCEKDGRPNYRRFCTLCSEGAATQQRAAQAAMVDDRDREREETALRQAYTAAAIRKNEEIIAAEIQAEDDGPEASNQSPKIEKDLKDQEALQVTVWSMSGAKLCSLRLAATAACSDVMQEAAKASAIRQSELKLFWEDRELALKTRLSDIASGCSLDLNLLRIDPEWQTFNEVVSYAGCQLAVAPARLQADKQLVLRAVRQNGHALEYASESLKAEKEVVLAAVQDAGLALQFASARMRDDVEVVQAAVTQNGNALNFASSRLQGDAELVLAAVASPGAFQFASEALRCDRNVVLAAVDLNGLCLEFASGQLKEDREVVLTAVRQDGLALEFAFEELRADREIVMEAVQVNGLALWDAHESLKADREILANCRWG